MKLWRFFGAAIVALMLWTGQSFAADPENTLYLELKDGRVVIEMRPDLAPRHVERIKTLARAGFYDNTPIHRVIEGFMAQMGDPSGTGSGGSDLPDLKSEFSAEKHERGTLSMARTSDPNSANSQFFIMFGRTPSLDRQYSVWGRVTEGMEHVDKIKRGAGRNGIVRQPDRIVSLKVAADAN
ncbi:MAG: peptidylprolyl isomerase [Alphaproteobacteria bacterium]|nr:peptidylprolyl isomerase [Alphaproteobacteria bacterium]